MSRKSKKEKAPRAPRAKVSLIGKPRVYCPSLGNMAGTLITQGPEQSAIWLDDTDRSSRELIVPNSWYRIGEPPVRRSLARVPLKVKRVRLLEGRA